MLDSFEAFIDRASDADTTDRLVATFLATVRQHGLDRMIFCLQTPHEHLISGSGVGIIQNYPEDWMKHYFEKGFDRLDPVITYCQTKMDTFTWAEIPERMQMTRSQFRCLNMGIEAGLYNGICTPLWGPDQFAGVGLASSVETDSFDGRLDLIAAYCQHFYLAFQRLNLKPDIETPNIYLTPREQEVLTWAFAGKSNTDIGAILKVTEHAVDYHFRQIFRKLGVNSRRLAVFRARSLGLIRP